MTHTQPFFMYQSNNYQNHIESRNMQNCEPQLCNCVKVGSQAYLAGLLKVVQNLFLLQICEPNEETAEI